MGKAKIIGLAVAAIPATSLLLFLQYYLPSTHKVQITGTSVKRMDVASDDGMVTSHDMRFITTRDPTDGETYVFRNEDTRWGWPPYFKFDSGDLDGDAISIKESQPNAVVLITYYGWRVPMMDVYPNAIDLEIVDPRYTHIPVFNVFVLLVLFGCGGYLYYRGRKWWRGWRQRRAGGSAPVPAGASTQVRSEGAAPAEPGDPPPP